MNRRVIFTVLLLALTSVLGYTPVGAAGPRPIREWPEGWSKERTIGTASPFSLRKRAIAGREGQLHLLWINTAGGDESVVFCTLVNGEAVRGPETISLVSGSIKAVNLCRGQEGVLCAVWALRTDSRRYELHAAKLNENGRVLVPDHVILSGEGLVEDPAASFDSSGNLHVFWGDWREENYRLCHVVLAADTVTVLRKPADFAVPGRSPGSPAACFDPLSGGIHLVWTSTYEGTPCLWHTKVPAEGSPLSAARRIGPWYSGEKGLPAVAVDPQGRMHLVWTVFQSGGGLAADRRFLYHAALRSDGSLHVAPHRVPAAGGNPCWPSAAADSSGHLHVVWSDNKSAAFQVYYAQLNEEGVPIGSPQLLDVGTSASLAAQAVVDPQGHRYVFWTRFREGDRSASIGMVETLHPAHATVWRRAGLDEEHPLGNAVYTAAGVLLVYVMPLVTLSAMIPVVLLVLLWGLGKLGVRINAQRHWLAFSVTLLAAVLLLEETPLFFARGRFLGAGFESGAVLLSALTTILILRPGKLGTLETVGGKLLFIVVFLSCQVFLTMLAAQVAGIGW